MSNRLNHEKSPYLLQHADNPVDWHPWSDDVFAIAKKRDVPVFLSIGYATCHWCHVMAHESFEDDEVANLMNEAFINIKVDREERPDIDSTYMRICQMMTGQGGWPLTIIMTPDKDPFFSATYIPKNSRGNRLGMLDLIPRIRDVWTSDRNRVSQSASRIRQEFNRTLETKQGDLPGPDTVSDAFRNLQETYDVTHGGFGGSPKFPSPHTLSFLLAYSTVTGQTRAVEMASQTLEKMRFGGIFDHVGFGFHRYSTDRRWFLPHFEKMLYDQALLMKAYTDAWKITGKELFRQTVYEIFSYVDSKLTDSDGGFYSAEDADSDGEEGKFYVWTLEEIQSLLDPGDAALLADIYSLDPDGNFKDEATGLRTKQNILSLQKSVSSLARERQMEEEDLRKRLDSIRNTLFEQREQRVRPILDDKVLTDWNGLMISSLSHAASVFQEESFLKAAEKAASFISDTLKKDDHRLLHRYRDGEAAIDGMADDYSFYIDGLISLFQTNWNTEYLDSALTLCTYFMDHFMDQESGGFFLTGSEADPLLGRQKEIYDGAIPSSNSVMAYNLVRLSRLTGESRYEEAAEQLFKSFSRSLSAAPQHSSRAIEALLFSSMSSYEIVICGPADHPDLRRMADVINQTVRAPHVLIVKNETNASELSRLAPYTASYPLRDTPEVYICKDFTCKAPVRSFSELQDVISQLHS